MLFVRVGYQQSFTSLYTYVPVIFALGSTSQCLSLTIEPHCTVHADCVMYSSRAELRYLQSLYLDHKKEPPQKKHMTKSVTFDFLYTCICATNQDHNLSHHLSLSSTSLLLFLHHSPNETRTKKISRSETRDSQKSPRQSKVRYLGCSKVSHPSRPPSILPFIHGERRRRLGSGSGSGSGGRR